MTEKSILSMTIKGESAVTASTFMEMMREVHLPSWHRDHFLKCKGASAEAVISMKRTLVFYT